jgi:23S rRNA (cytosine1962-C5)-methyltransferase
MTNGVKAVWRLKKGMDRRFRSGHPWVYSNELGESPKGIEPGAPIELQDPGGSFLAYGYGNPKSLIAFRTLTRKKEDASLNNLFSTEFLAKKLLAAHALRLRQGLTPWSYRLCYGEGDFVPGLIIDRFRTEEGQIFVVQAHTAGADRYLRFLPEALEALTREAALREAALKNSEAVNPVAWENTAIIYNNDLGVRTLEGLQPEAPKVIRTWDSANSGKIFSNVKIWVRPALGKGKPVLFLVDLLEGQKTGFFLDQASNITLAAERFADLAGQAQGVPAKTIRILDLCCYVGQWSTQLARVFRERGVHVQVTAVDASQSALDFARENIEKEGAKVTLLKGDVLKDLDSLDAKSFDLVICDPPALIKGRKDIPHGKHAYLQLNTQAFRLVKAGGALVSCSCSALLEEVDFHAALSKAARRNEMEVQWVGRGSQAPDHPMLLEFPEGRYLKSMFGLVR